VEIHTNITSYSVIAMQIHKAIVSHAVNDLQNSEVLKKDLQNREELKKFGSN
jgi:hypothetical protein